MEEELKKIINYYGIMDQLKYIHSEYFELDEAIIKAEQYEPKSFTQMNVNVEYYVNHIAEEIADVMVMLEQIRLYYGIPSMQITEIMQQKIERQLQRIDADGNK